MSFKMRFILLFLLLISSAEASTKLLMIGGGPRPIEAMNAFVKSAGGEKAKILICSWASASIESAETIRNELEISKPESIEIMPTYPMKSEDESKLLTLIRSATGIFFTGGDQNQLMLAIQNQQLKKTFKEAYQNGTTFAGTSAGTAIMSERMITGDTTPLAEGLGLLPSEIIVDQHFIVRNRFQRLARLVLENDETFGIGIDEGTSLLVINNRIGQVIGPSSVVLFSKDSVRKVSMEFFKPNEMINLFGLKQ